MPRGPQDSAVEGGLVAANSGSGGCAWEGNDTHSSAASRFVGSRTLEKSSASATSEMNEIHVCISTHIEDALGVENGMDN